MEMYSEIMEQQFTGDNQVIKIRCEDDKDLAATKEMAIEVHALAGRLFRFFDGEQERIDGDTEFLGNAWRVLKDLWEAGFNLYIEGEDKQ